ncbi:MAG: hypothetical protein A2W68_11525 [Betaproteobacteria bacterium RIFCSPLOWO2_02_64_14]|nr:MAG: hypothetical protein A2W68_11525 [Betaproteobacteria bacterium RIFCSPLOWO2_02_64_14]
MWILALGATLLTAAAPARAVSPPEPPKGLSAPPQATPMPVFELPVVNGTKARSTDLRDKVTVIRFWATW